MATTNRDHSLTVIRALIVGVSVFLAGRLVYVQVFRHDFYLHLATIYHPSDRPRAGPPGAILTRSGHILADSVTVASLKVDPHIARDKEDLAPMARFIGKQLGVDESQVREKLHSNAPWEYLARKVDLEVASSIMDARFAGVQQDLEYRRNYPNGPVACHVVGVRGSDHRPREGLEYRYRFLLDGQPGTRITNVDAFDRTIVGQENQPALPPLPGMDLVTTLDLSVQRAVEAELDRCVSRTRPKAATCVVMDCRSGEILALGCRPCYDPNRIAGAPAGATHVGIPTKNLLNLCVSRQYEPGSTFKPLLIAAALDAGAIKPTDTFLCKGTETIGGKPLRCWGPWATRGHGRLTAEEVIVNSCNLGAAHIALKLGAEPYYDFLQRVGFAQKPRSGLASEVAGHIQKPEEMYERDLANLGFGQGVGVTDIQLAAAISAIVNGGIYYRPYIIRAVRTKEGDVYREANPPQGRQICSEATSKLVRKMLVAAVERGTGRQARIKGACVGGKTGTAQIWNPKTQEFDGNIMSFVMAAPLDTQPQFVILVTVQEPAVGEHGADVAAPVAREIAKSLLRRQGLLKAEAAS